MTTRSTILALAAVTALAASAFTPTSASAARTFSTFSHVGRGMTASIGRSVPHIPGPLGISASVGRPVPHIPGPLGITVNPGLNHYSLGSNRLPSGPHPQFDFFRRDHDHDHDKSAFYKKPIDIDCVTFKPHCDHDHDHDWDDHDHDHDHDHDWWWWRHHRRDYGYYPWWGSPYVIGGDAAVGAPASMAAPVGPIASPASPAAAPCTCLTKRYLDDGSVLFTDVCTKEQAMATPGQLQGQAQNQ